MKKRIYIDGIDGLRAIAASLVLLFHYYSFAGSPKGTHFLVRTGWVGVDIFFVISGFVLFLPMRQAFVESSSFSVEGFYRRRLARILPAYCFNLLVLVTFFYAGVFFRSDLVAQLLRHVTFTQGFTLPHTRLNINGVYWTLWVEMSFYLILPLLAYAFRGRKWWLPMLVLFAAVMIYRISAINLNPVVEVANGGYKLRQYWANTILPGVLHEFGVGMAVACLYLDWKDKPWWNQYRTPLSLLTVLGSAVIVAALAFLTNYGSTQYWNGRGPLGIAPLAGLNLVLAIGAGLMILGLTTQTDWIKLVFGNKVMTFLGTVSYGIYLWHYPVGKYMAPHLKLDPVIKLPILVLAGGALTIVWAWFSYQFVEKPFLKSKVTTTASSPLAGN